MKRILIIVGVILGGYFLLRLLWAFGSWAGAAWCGFWIVVVFICFVLLYNYVPPINDAIHTLFGWELIDRSGHGHGDHGDHDSHGLAGDSHDRESDAEVSNSLHHHD